MIYFIRDSDCVKVGFSTDVQSRLGGLQVGNPRELSLWALFPGDLYSESMVHEHFDNIGSLVRGEWYCISDEITTCINEWISDGKITFEDNVPGRRVKIRDFRSNLASELSDLPFTLMKGHKPIAVVVQPGREAAEGVAKVTPNASSDTVFNPQPKHKDQKGK